MINNNLQMQTTYLGNEQNKLVVCDNFLANPADWVEYAASVPFAASPMLRQRKGYPGIRAGLTSNFVSPLATGLEKIIRDEFALPETLTVDKPQSALCLTAVPERELGPLQTIPHFDTSQRHYFAALMYLCGDEHGGTGFYQHNSTGFESIQPERSEQYLDKCHEELSNKKIRKRYFSESDDYYTKIGFVAARFNRLVIYRGCLLHSANLTSLISLNTNPRVGRLTANFFLNFS